MNLSKAFYEAAADTHDARKPARQLFAMRSSTQ